MVMKWASLCLTTVGISVVLQGCGGGGDKPKTTTEEASVTTVTDAPPAPGSATTTTPSSGKKHDPMSSSEVADLLNKQYMAYDAENETSDIGVVIQMHDSFEFFCSKTLGSKCHGGMADCRVATSLYNHKMMYDPDTGYATPTMGRKTGVVFNTDQVRTKFAKCAWQYDGGTDHRLNGGCGCGALASDCKDKRSAFYNLDPETYEETDETAAGGQEVTATSPDVTRCACSGSPEHAGPKHPVDPVKPQCYWKGSAFYNGEGTDDIRKMITQRVAHQEGTRNDTIQWNEIVLDGAAMTEELKRDPANTILAIVFVVDPKNTEVTAVARNMAIQMQTTMRKNYEVTVPLVGINIGKSVTEDGAKGPFESTDGVEARLQLLI